MATNAKKWWLVGDPDGEYYYTTPVQADNAPEAVETAEGEAGTDELAAGNSYVVWELAHGSSVQVKTAVKAVLSKP